MNYPCIFEGCNQTGTEPVEVSQGEYHGTVWLCPAHLHHLFAGTVTGFSVGEDGTTNPVLAETRAEAAEQVVKMASAYRMIESGELTRALGMGEPLPTEIAVSRAKLDTALAEYQAALAAPPDLEARAGASAATPVPVGDSPSELQQPPETVGPPTALPVPETQP